MGCNHFFTTNDVFTVVVSGLRCYNCTSDTENGACWDFDTSLSDEELAVSLTSVHTCIVTDRQISAMICNDLNLNLT